MILMTIPGQKSFLSRQKAELDMPKGGYESIDMLKAIQFEYIDGYATQEDCIRL